MSLEDAPKKKCPWCPEPGGCRGCSLTGDDPDSYILVPETIVKERLRRAVRRARHGWLLVVIGLLGALLGTMALVLGLLFSGP